MLDQLKLIYLRRKARGLVTSIYAEFASAGCGNRLALELKPHIWELARKADAIMDRIKQIDPHAPDTRIIPQLKEMAK